MALSRDDLTFDKGNIGYGTMASEAAPPGSAGDLAAEAATAGIVNTDVSAELAQQVPNIVVPVNQSSDSDTTNTDYVGYYGGDNYTGGLSGDTQQSGPGRSFSDDDPLAGGKDYQAGIFDSLPKMSLIGSILNMIAPGSGIAYNYAMAKKAKAAQEQRIDDAIREADLAKKSELETTIDTATTPEELETARINSITQGYGGYDESEGATGPTAAGAGMGVDGGFQTDYQGEIVEPEPTYTAPAVDLGYDANVSSDGDGGGGGGYDGGSASSKGDEDMATGGIVRLRKNKQNSRIHDRRKRLAIGGIASLHGQNNTSINISVKRIQSVKCSIFKQRFRCCTTKT